MRLWLVVLLVLPCCGPPQVVVVPAVPGQPVKITRIILANDLPGDAEFCVQLQNDTSMDTVNVTGPRLACWGTIGSLRALVVGQQRAN